MPQLLSLDSRAQEPQLLNPMFPRAFGLQQEKPLQWEPEPHNQRWPPVTTTREKPLQQQRSKTAKNK